MAPDNYSRPMACFFQCPVPQEHILRPAWNLAFPVLEEHISPQRSKHPVCAAMVANQLTERALPLRASVSVSYIHGKWKQREFEINRIVRRNKPRE